MDRIAIIGAGISGLAAARALDAAGKRAVVFEKSRSLGGRCSSRLWEGCVFDHGAQYFTARDAAFREVLAELGDAVGEIPAPVVDADGCEVGTDTRRLFHVEGNNRLARALAAGLEIRRESPVGEVSVDGGDWEVAGERFDAILSCAPWPQTAALLGRTVAASPYERNLTAAFAYDVEWAGRARTTYAVSDRSGSALAWSACENHKAARVPAGRLLFVVQAAAEFSAGHWDAERDVWAAKLRSELEPRWELDPTRFAGAFTHRWGFSRRVAAADVGELPSGFFVCGDSITDSRIEAVWLSGRRAAAAMLG